MTSHSMVKKTSWHNHWLQFRFSAVENTNFHLLKSTKKILSLPFSIRIRANFYSNVTKNYSPRVYIAKQMVHHHHHQQILCRLMLFPHNFSIFFFSSFFRFLACIIYVVTISSRCWFCFHFQFCSLLRHNVPYVFVCFFFVSFLFMLLLLLHIRCVKQA